MKLAVTAQGQELTSPVDPRFGRAKFFIIFDTDTGTFEAVDNKQNLNASQGAGIQAGKAVVDRGVGALITGSVGPKAFVTLQAGAVEVYTGGKGTVAEAIEQFNKHELNRADGANVESHWL